ncbi:hypothetical protein V2A60_000078 [Cordyceps javanica]|uniref:Hepatocellular carcinoma-associated antigen 59 domain-containing protein n=1 Tax=Cordyceps javanica TaxID=43265 RepID=A0A545W3K4_9HYPO|nr:hepatocellular carcinoma-associated antigen 59 domain-containing protein [Cordyceps javanica]TQW08542.1 hepatocellular carcinoma-associated antigen 59 domain-containing protein [Cordyceps javanica]
MEPDEPGIRFKAKKRGTKTLRQRDRAESPEAGAPSATAAAAPTSQRDAPTPDRLDEEAASSSSSSSNDGSAAVQAALKLRQARSKNRFRGGVGFGRDEPANGAGDADGTAETGLVLHDAAHGLPDRFMHQTGFVADADDRHMMAYVESRLSSRAGADSAEPASGGDRTDHHHHHYDRDQDHQLGARPAQRHPPRSTVQTATSTTSWTRLVEVQVPPDLRGNNNGKNNNNNAAGTDGRGGGSKRGLDAAGKPQSAPRRRRNRRGSDDMKRDAMVEAFLHENRLDVYDVPAASSASSQPADGAQAGRTADDALAADFRRQYMAEMAVRRQRRRPAINQPRVTQRQLAHQQAVAAGEVLKGPKLGGSRNARAAVRDALLQEQELKKRSR